jgi:hypothetical protein
MISILPWYIIALIVAFIFIYIELFRIRDYNLSEDKLIILRRIKNIAIDLSRINEIIYINTKKATLQIRLIGLNFGSLGYFGIFLSIKYGFGHLYLTNKKNVLLIKLDKNRKILISPNDVIRDRLNLLTLKNKKGDLT